jgi:hypothetical protein
VRTVLLVCLSVAPVLGQFSASAATDAPVATAAGEQAVPRIAATSDGGCYVGWFDNRSGSYAVYLQRLDATGAPLWPTNGVLVSGQPQSSSLVGWDLICDREDHCVLTFTDTRSGADLDVYAYRIAPNGTMVWGANGVTLSNNGDYEANPTVCEADDGDFVFVWPNTAIAALVMQRLDRQGVPRFGGGGLVIPGDAGAVPAFAQIVAVDQGSVVVAWVRTMTFSGARHLHAQKFSAAGVGLWNGGSRLAVFDQTSLPIAHQPRLLSDGQGGAVVGWHYAVGTQFSAKVQHLSAAGVESFPHNGVALSTNGNSCFDPALAWLPASGDILAVFNERNSLQLQWGISAQKITAAGQRAFGNGGLSLVPVGSPERQYPVAVPSFDGITAFVFEAQATPTHYKVLGMRVDAAGNVAVAPMDVAAFSSPKLHIVAAGTTSGTALCAWSDRRVDGGDIRAQSLNPDGSLRPNPAAVVLLTGCGNNPAGSLMTSGRPAVGAAMSIGVDNPLGTQAPGSLAFLAYSFVPNSGPCGLPGAGMGMGGAGAVGDILVDQSTLSTTFGGNWSGPLAPVQFALLVPPTPALYGVSLVAQGALFDPTPGASVGIGLTQALLLTIGS